MPTLLITLVIFYSKFVKTFWNFLIGGRTSDEIVSWLKKKTGPAAKTLSSVDEVKTFVDGLQVAVVGFFKDTTSPAAKAFLSAADEVDSVQFAITSDDAVFKDNNVDGEAVVLFKKVI